MDNFEKGFLSAFIGYRVGRWLDSTRFGIWFNNNKVIDFIYRTIGRLLLITIFVLIVYYIILAIGEFTN